MTRSDAWWATGLVVSATVCGVLTYRLAATRTEIQKEVTQLDTLQKRVLKLERAAPTSAAQTSVIATGPAAPVPEKSTAPKPLSLSAARRAYEEGLLQMYADPQARRIIRLAYKGHERTQHPGLARSLGLSAEEEDRLFELLAEQRIVQAEGFGRDRGIDVQYEEQARARDIEHMSVLSADQYRRFQHYKETRLDRLRVRQFRRQLAPKDDLAEDTAERLVEVLATAREEHNRQFADPPADSGGSSFVGRYGFTMHIGPGEADVEKAASKLEDSDRRVTQATSSVLTAAQQQQFVDYLRQSRESTVAMLEEIHSRQN